MRHIFFAAAIGLIVYCVSGATASAANNPFSQSLDDYSSSITLDTAKDQYVIHWWGTLANGFDFDKLKTFGEAFPNMQGAPKALTYKWNDIKDRKVLMVYGSWDAVQEAATGDWAKAANINYVMLVAAPLVTCTAVNAGKTVFRCTEDVYHEAEGKTLKALLYDQEHPQTNFKVAFVTAGYNSPPKDSKEWFVSGENIKDENKNGIYDVYEGGWWKFPIILDLKGGQGGTGSPSPTPSPEPSTATEPSTEAGSGEGASGTNAPVTGVTTESVPNETGQPAESGAPAGASPCTLVPASASGYGIMLMLAAIVPLALRRRT